MAPRAARDGVGRQDRCGELRADKYPARNGGRKIEDLIDHIGKDRLVGRAWPPGFGHSAAPGTQIRSRSLRRGLCKDRSGLPQVMELRSGHPDSKQTARRAENCGSFPPIQNNEMSDLFGGRTRARTWDPLIKSQLLYQLSYAPGSNPDVR